MCTSPLHLIRPNLGFSFDVPCNHCLECQSASQDSWLFRISHDLKSLYGRKGFGVFLTFTYSDRCLPQSDFSFKGCSQSCFNSDDVTRFLNKVKVYMSRTYGKGAYKYFLCSEYGKYTKRPHYHCLFMLESYVDFVSFCEHCRTYWSYGYMFPRSNNGYYYDNLGHRTTPLIHNVSSCCKYVVKYVTKDLDFYDIPLIKDYLSIRNSFSKEVRSYYNKFLPRHYQSKGIGSSFFDLCSSPDSLLNYVKNGVVNPATLKVVQLPRYYIEHFAFSHIPCTVNGHKFINRSLRDGYSAVVQEVFNNSFRSRIARLDNFLLNVTPSILKDYGYSVSDYKSIVKAKRLGSECLVLQSFYNNLSPKTRWYFDNFYSFLSLRNVSRFRVDLLTLDFDYFPDSFRHFDFVDDFMAMFYRIDNGRRSSLLSSRYNDFLILKKLKLKQKHLI